MESAWGKKLKSEQAKMPKWSQLLGWGMGPLNTKETGIVPAAF
jgi:hypothetical protein